MTTKGNLLDLGQREYAEVWELQRKLVDLRARKQIPDSLILVEHPHVFTVGKAVSGDIPHQIDGVPVFRIEWWSVDVPRFGAGSGLSDSRLE